MSRRPLDPPSAPGNGDGTGAGPTHDADDALDPRLLVLSHAPLNAELPPVHQESVITPNHLFFHRNRFQPPALDSSSWRLTVGGEVTKPLSLGYADLLEMPGRTLAMTLECAGNGRSSFEPPADGEPWGYGAVGTAEWTGVPLAVILRAAGLTAKAVEILAEGADGGIVEEGEPPTRFARSLPVEMALHPDTLVAYAMNGEPLPRRHGYPARLVVPGWYGVASVKWLTTVTALDRPFTGYFQTRRYIVPSDDGSAPRPLTRVAPRSLIVAPEDGSTVRPGRRGVRGLAWSGHGPVELVEVSTDGGQSWRPAQWTGTLEPHAWRIWEFPWDAEPGEYVLQSRATDAAGNTQPVTAEWNRLGYANNAIHSVRVTCAGDPLDL